jgi:hypothetical protein
MCKIDSKMNTEPANMTQVQKAASSADTSIDVVFGRTLLRVVMDDIKKVTTGAERKAAWVYKVGRDHWEFHGPDGYYWHGSASNAYDARATGWQKWWAKLEDDAARMEARLLGQKQRAAASKRQSSPNGDK